jgi:hypothetical protein
MPNKQAESFRAVARGLRQRIRWGYDPTYGSSDEDAARDKAAEVADAIEAETVAEYASG